MGLDKPPVPFKLVCDNDASCCPADLTPVMGTAGSDNIATNTVGLCHVMLNGLDTVTNTSASGRHAIFGGPGFDTLQGGHGPGIIDGGDGDDSITGRSSADFLRGGVTTVAGTLVVASNDAMLDCTGLESLTSTGSINVFANAMLATVDGLEAVATLRYQLRLTANPALTDVTALASGTVDASGSIEIKDNTILPQCDAESLAAAVRPADFTGDEDVSGNLGACS